MLPRLKSDLRALFSGGDRFNLVNLANRNDGNRVVTLDVTNPESNSTFTNVGSTLALEDNSLQNPAVGQSHEDGGVETTVQGTEDPCSMTALTPVATEPPMAIDEAPGSGALDLT